MNDFLVACSLVLVIEGLLWSLFPETMKRAVAQVLSMEPQALRGGGLALAAAGVLGVWLVRG